MEIIRDPFNRTIDYLRLSVTDRCNFRCSYCVPEGEFTSLCHEEILTYEEIEKLCVIFAELGIQKIKITGGEPLVRKGIVSLVEKLHNISGISQITMTTNGLLLGEYASELKDAGLSGVNISLDSLKAEVFEKITGVNGLPQVLDSIDKALEVKIPSVKINCVPMQGVNEEELCDLAAFAKMRAIDVRFIEMMPVGNGKEQQGLSEEKVKQQLCEAYGPMKEIKQMLGNGPAVYVQPAGFTGHIGFISAMSHRFCKNCNRIRLTSDGILKPCLQYEGHLNLKEMIRGGATKDDIKAAILKAICEKPQCHQFQNAKENNSFKSCESLEQRMMTSIGG